MSGFCGVASPCSDEINESVVEVRAPYLDRALIERSTKLPASYDGGRTYVSLKTQLGKAFEADLPRPVLERKVIGYPSYYWTNGELDRLKARLLSREAIEADGLLDYQAVQEVLEAERHSDAKSRGKHGWALVQLALWHRIHLRRDPEFTEPAAQA